MFCIFGTDIPIPDSFIFNKFLGRNLEKAGYMDFLSFLGR